MSATSFQNPDSRAPGCPVCSSRSWLHSPIEAIARCWPSGDQRAGIDLHPNKLSTTGRSPHEFWISDLNLHSAYTGQGVRNENGLLFQFRTESCGSSLEYQAERSGFSASSTASDSNPGPSSATTSRPYCSTRSSCSAGYESCSCIYASCCSCSTASPSQPCGPCKARHCNSQSQPYKPA